MVFAVVLETDNKKLGSNSCYIEMSLCMFGPFRSINIDVFYDLSLFVDKYRGFWVWGVQKCGVFCRYVFSCMYNSHVFYRANRVLHTWIEGPFCVETSEL